ncbi:DoxX family membrane protein [Arenibacter sp. GZD96]|uniref:DoxX family protein n=1 Tax=Aurantibrevibacter litoralis TaxID=3106030 RepID=UPI002AFE604D|nr:DoxX family membrane protein [Arenibacter sp. GZD-96]MEA1785914.1 DoxX family membrane protein [Arenibacter sp. GZD-96]
MNAKIFLVLRIVFGLFLLIFGANKFLQFMPMGEMSESAGAYFGALMSAKVLPLVAIIEILAGLALLLNKYAPLMLLILASVSVNAVLFHATLAPEGIAPAALLLILNIVLLYHYKDRYKDILKA